MWHEKAFFPPSPFFLLTGARSQHVRIPAAGCASELVRAESFYGGLVGMTEHDAQPLLKISLCVFSESERTFFLCCSYNYNEGCWACKRQGEQKNWFVLSLFWGGVLLGIMLAEHDAQPLSKISSCVIVLRANAQFFICLCGC